MKFIRSAVFGTIAALSLATASAAIVTEATRTYSVNLDIPDYQDPPQTFLQTISDSLITSLTQVQVSLNLVGNPSGSGFASEMTVFLNKDLGASAMLLNRVGISGTDAIGQSYDGWNVTFSDNAGSDIHLATLGSGVLSGTYQPDGRVLPTDTLRPEMLSVFNGGTGNGDWRLAIADLELGGTMRIQSWSLTLTGEAVPEPSTWGAIGALVGVTGLTWWRRTRRSA